MPCMMATAAYREARSEGFRECRADWRSRQISAESAQQDLVKQEDQIGRTSSKLHENSSIKVLCLLYIRPH